MSQASQPSAVISARLIGRNGAGVSVGRRRDGESGALWVEAGARRFMPPRIGLRRRKFNQWIATGTHPTWSDAAHGCGLKAALPDQHAFHGGNASDMKPVLEMNGEVQDMAVLGGCLCGSVEFEVELP